MGLSFLESQKREEEERRREEVKEEKEEEEEEEEEEERYGHYLCMDHYGFVWKVWILWVCMTLVWIIMDISLSISRV